MHEDDESSIQKLNKEREKNLKELSNIKEDNKCLNQQLNNNRRHHFIDISKYDLDHEPEIGRGAFAIVKKKAIEINYAFKILSVISSYKSESFHKKCKSLLSEYELLNTVNHPNIIKTFGFFVGDHIKPPTIMLEFCPGDLSSKIDELTDVQIVSIIYEISIAMKNIHARNIIHRDLKPQNILLDENNNAKVSDFGIARLVSGEESTILTQRVGTVEYMAPEVLDGLDYDNTVDVYSFGVVMHFILTKGKVKFNKRKEYEIPPEINLFSGNIISKCCSYTPKDRPTFHEISKLIFENNFQLIDDIDSSLVQDHLKKIMNLDEDIM
ncbi:hypothetical protein M9Y10_017532 [Tritrichomonas musculus]|uniref:Protein kinase domain-containing protein n=1 Tax=Tritrichomonas musculus TaxID=1915356 RepID=A0ABR2HTT6_9EUKA